MKETIEVGHIGVVCGQCVAPFSRRTEARWYAPRVIGVWTRACSHSDAGAVVQSMVTDEVLAHVEFWR